MIGSVIAITLFGLATSKTYYPSSAHEYTQLFSGAYLSMRMEQVNLIDIGSLRVPVLMMMISVIAFTFLTSYGIHGITKMNLSIFLMLSTPGGFQKISIWQMNLVQTR